MRLFQKLRNKPFCNNVHFFMFLIILLMLTIKYYFFSIFLMIYLIFIIKKTKLIIPIFITLGILIIELFIINSINYSDTNIIAKIEEVKDNSYIASYRGIKYQINDKNKDYIPGDIVEFDITYLDISEKSYDTDFDYKQYLKSNKILYLARANKSSKLRGGFSFNLLKYYYQNYLKNNININSFQYVNALVLGDNNLESDLKQGYSILGISHILAISGMHIMLLFQIISFLLLKVFHYYKKKLPLIIITTYVILIGAPISALRALIFLIIKYFNDKSNIKYTNLDILSITFILLMFIWPYTFYNQGFILTFLVSFILIFSNEIIKTKHKLLNMYLTYYLIYFSTLPIVISFNNYISIITLLISPILSVLVTFVVMPLSFIVAIIPISNNILSYVFLFLNNYIIWLSNIKIGFNIISFNIILKLIYYFIYIMLIISIIKKKNIIRYLVIYGVFIVGIINIKLINPITKITFIDVGQGDSCLIELNNNRGTILIDCYNCFDYLKNEGISTIDYMILTHSDNDHIKDSVEVYNYFNVKNVLIPFNDDGFNIIGTKVKSGSYFNIDNIKFEILGPIKTYDEKNSNSIVLKFIINNISFLFTGDMTIEEEKDIINKYKNKLDVDILKVGHHGSNTSSSNEFINCVTPKESIISVAKYNSYNLPNEEVVERLNKISNVYMTKDLGNIIIHILGNKYYIGGYKGNVFTIC